MSDQQVVVVNKHRSKRLNLDSEEQARIQAEEQERQEQIRQKKQEKRRRREQQARRAQQQEKKKQDLQKHYQNPQTMLQPDSDSNDTFVRAQKKIKKAYPNYKSRQDHQHRHKHISDSQESESQSEEDSESKSEEEESAQQQKKTQKKVKNDKNDRKEKKKRQDSQQIRAASKARVEKVKIQDKDPKQILVSEVAIRWWYCLPEWPPVDYDYEKQLKKLGYRLIENSRFRMEQNLVNGLLKATPIDGYVGIFKTKQKILDIRPKQNCPSLQFLRNKTMEQLTNLLRTSLKEQINQLNNLKYQTNEDLEVITHLTRRLHQLH